MADLEEPRHTDQRLAAMLDRSPIHTVLFSRSGKVLCANKAAMSRIQTSHAGYTVPINCSYSWMQLGCYAVVCAITAQRGPRCKQKCKHVAALNDRPDVQAKLHSATSHALHMS